MMEQEHPGERDLRDVLDNPEWSEEDIRAERPLSAFAPELAKNIARALGRPVPPDGHPKVDPSAKHRADVST